jgi:hypothetical protein
VNKDRIFNLFDEGKKDIEEVKVSLNDFLHSPYAKIGMFTKLILNHFTFHEKLQKFLEKEEPTYNVESTKEASSFVVFNRAWHYIKQINIDDKETVFSILDFNPKLLNKAIESAIIFFEEYEEYEKCAHLFKIQQILKESKR